MHHRFMTCCISHIKHFIFPLGIAQVTYVVHIVLNMCNMYDTKAHLSKYIFSCSDHIQDRDTVVEQSNTLTEQSSHATHA